MSDETPRLHQFVEEAVGKYFAARGGGMASTIVVAVEGVAQDGSPVIVIGDTTGQSLVGALGLVELLHRSVGNDAEYALAGGCSCESCGEED